MKAIVPKAKEVSTERPSTASNIEVINVFGLVKVVPAASDHGGDDGN
jgi:hypothetical protein